MKTAALITLVVDNRPLEFDLTLPNVPEVGQFLVFTTSKVRGRFAIKSIAYEIAEVRGKYATKLLVNLVPEKPKTKKATKSMAQMRSEAKKR